MSQQRRPPVPPAQGGEAGPERGREAGWELGGEAGPERGEAGRARAGEAGEGSRVADPADFGERAHGSASPAEELVGSATRPEPAGDLEPRLAGLDGGRTGPARAGVGGAGAPGTHPADPGEAFGASSPGDEGTPASAPRPERTGDLAPAAAGPALLRRLFGWYARRRIARELDGLWVSGLEEARALLRERPVVFAVTHVAWWDGLLLLPLDDAMGRTGRVLMDAANLAAVPYFRWLGALPLHRSSPARMRAGLRAGLAWLAGPEAGTGSRLSRLSGPEAGERLAWSSAAVGADRDPGPHRPDTAAARTSERPGSDATDRSPGLRPALWIFPQGRQRPHHLRPLGLQRGYELLTDLSGAALVPVALGYGFREDSAPAAVVAFRPPVPPEELEAALDEGLLLVDRFLDRGKGPFVPLVPPRRVRTDQTVGARVLGRALGARRAPGRAVVIGAGLGGLAAAIRLAARGWRVDLVERHDRPGGKAGSAEVDGVRFDTGPSVLTLPEVFDATFRDAGTTLAAEVELVRPSPSFRYRWPDGTELDVFVDPDETLASVARTLGPAAERELAAFLAYSKRIWDAAAPRFVLGPAPGVRALLSVSALRDLAAIDPLRTMAGAIEARVRDPHLRDVLLRYATYNGSDPRRAPATLNCIAHVELALGGYGVKGGVGALVAALVRAAERVGVRFHFGRPVERLRVDRGRVQGVWTDAGELAADVVVSNAEVTHTLRDLVGRGRAPEPTSTSGWTAVARASRPDRPGGGAGEGGGAGAAGARRGRAAHTVLFPADYRQEFVDLFDRGRVPADPTVYASAPALAHAAPGWADHEPLFVMVNAPAARLGGAGDEETDWAALEAQVHRKLVDAGLLAPEDRFVWRRTPADLAAAFPGSGGALYGAASNGPLAAFRRPANRVPGVAGLFLAGGSAHPGGGMPLCVLSGRAAADAALEGS